MWLLTQNDNRSQIWPREALSVSALAPPARPSPSPNAVAAPSPPLSLPASDAPGNRLDNALPLLPPPVLVPGKKQASQRWRPRPKNTRQSLCFSILYFSSQNLAGWEENRPCLLMLLCEPIRLRSDATWDSKSRQTVCRRRVFYLRSYLPEKKRPPYVVELRKVSLTHGCNKTKRR